MRLWPDIRSIAVPQDVVEALEFYAEDTATTFEEFAQLVLAQGLAAYTQARVDDGQRYWAQAD